MVLVFELVGALVVVAAAAAVAVLVVLVLRQGRGSGRMLQLTHQQQEFHVWSAFFLEQGAREGGWVEVQIQ